MATPAEEKDFEVMVEEPLCGKSLPKYFKGIKVPTEFLPPESLPDRNNKFTTCTFVLIGIGCRYKRLGFIDVQACALGMYAECNALEAAMKENGPNGAFQKGTKYDYDWIENHKKIPKMSKLIFLKTLTKGMVISSMNEDCLPHLKDKTEMKKFDPLMPTSMKF